MGRRGPAKTPTKILKLRGSLKAIGRVGEPDGPAGCPPFPEGWSESRRVYWNLLMQSLTAMGLESTADYGVCQNYVIAHERRDLADQEIAMVGRYMTAGNGTACVVPAVGELDRATEAMNKLGAKLGLSPADRAGLKADKPKAGGDPVARFLPKGRA